MRRYRSALLGLALLPVATSPGSAQLWFFPDYALPSPGSSSGTWIAGAWGRGLNDAAGELNGYGAAVGGSAGRTSFLGAFGYLDEEGGEYTAGGAIAYDLNTGSGTQASIQAGVGWLDLDFFGETVTFWRFPIGLAVKTAIQGESFTMTPWLMPRANVAWASGGGESETETDLGVSGGFWVTTDSGIGFHTAIDALFVDGDTPWLLGLGVHFLLGRR